MPNINVLLKDLKNMKQQLDPDGKGGAADEQEMTDRDHFDKKKLEFNRQIKDLRENVERLKELRQNAPDGRDAATIRQYSENGKQIDVCKGLFNDMKNIIVKDQKKGKVDEKTISDRKKLVLVYAQDLKEIAEKNAHVKGPKQTETQKAVEGRREERLRRRKEEKEKRAAKLEAKRERGEKTTAEDENPIGDEDIREVGPVSAQEQAFYTEVESAKEEQDQMLDEIIKGMTELKELATDMNTQIKAGTQLLNELDSTMTNTINTLKTSNERLKEIIETSGGLSRWCPLLLCFIVLLALCGYMFNMLG